MVFTSHVLQAASPQARELGELASDASYLRLGHSRSSCYVTPVFTRRLLSFVMAATDHLHRRMAKMSERIRQLEDALSILHNRTTDADSHEPHPLLRDEFLSIKAHKADEPPDDRKPDGMGVNGAGSGAGQGAAARG